MTSPCKLHPPPIADNRRAMPRPKQFDPDEAVERAAALFWRQGYNATTPEQLTADLGIGKGSFYLAFGSKRNIFDLALQRYRETRLAALAQMLEKPGPVKQRLRDALVKLAGGRSKPALRGCMAVNTAVELGSSDPTAGQAARTVFDDMEKQLLHAVQEGQSTGEIAADKDPHACASLLLATIIALQVLGRAQDSASRSRRIIDAALESL
jgi:TetR/AcrR family transcriptional repressor of nem operon